MPSLFPLGQVVITATARAQLDARVVFESVGRHERGDWGDVCDEDRRENEISLRAGFRLLSVYRDISNAVFWVITEADRSATTVLLPDDY